MKNINEALNRISWRMTNEKFTPNETDKLAVKLLSEYLNEIRKEELKKNELFAKAFCLLCIDTIRHYEGSVEHSVDRLGKEFEQPIEIIYSKVIETINDEKLNQLYKQLGLQNVPELLMNERQKQNKAEILNKNKEVILMYQKGILSQKEGFKWINNTILEFIRLFKSRKQS